MKLSNFVAVALLSSAACAYAETPTDLSANEIEVAADPEQEVGAVSTFGNHTVEAVAGRSANGDVPALGVAPALVAQGCYDRWWVSGRMNWEYKYYIFGGYNKLRGKSWTRYGTATAPCSEPLVVDTLRVWGSGRGSSFVPYIDKKAYNASAVEQTDSVSYVGGGPICGAVTWHSATKHGITWSVRVKDGC